MSKIINFIHIPKNAGSSIKEIIRNTNIKHYTGENVKKDFHSKSSTLKNQMIVLRNPIDRFSSSFVYLVENRYVNLINNVDKHRLFNDEEFIAIEYLINIGIDTPEKFVRLWMETKLDYNTIKTTALDKNVSYRFRVLQNILRLCVFFQKQSNWINKNTRYILILDNLNKEINMLFKTLNIDKILPHLNKSSINKNKYNLSQESIKFLKIQYREDFYLYNKYKNIPLRERIPIK